MNEVYRTRACPAKCFLAALCLALCITVHAGLAASGTQSVERTNVEKLVKRDGRWAHFTLLLDAPSGCPGFEADCCRILGAEAGTMKDFIDEQLGTCEKVEPYDTEKFRNLYPGGEGADLILYKIKPLDGTVGNLRVYTILHTNRYKNKETSFELSIVYDKARDKVLTIDDVFVHDMAAKIKADFGKNFINMNVSDLGIWCAYANDGKGFDFKDHAYSYRMYGEYLTEDFKQSIGFSELSQHFDEMEEKVYNIVHVGPKLALEGKALKEFFNKNFHWPDELYRKSCKGEFLVGCVVEKDGSISNVKIELRNRTTLNVSPLEKEMERVLNSMPRCTPALLYNTPVRASTSLFFSFTRKNSSGIEYIEHGSGAFIQLASFYENSARRNVNRRSYRREFRDGIF